MLRGFLAGFLIGFIFSNMALLTLAVIVAREFHP